MRCLGFLALVWVLMPAAAAATGADTAPAQPDSGLAFRVEIGSRLYPEWREEQRLHLGELFYLGDSEYTARLRRFVADLRIGEKGEILSASADLANPAVQVFVYHDSTTADSTWAFLNFPPHFSPRSFFTFQLKEVVGYRPGPKAPPAAASPHVQGETAKKPREKGHD